MIAESGLIPFFAKAALPFAEVAKPPVTVIVSPKLPPALPPRSIERPAEKRPVVVAKGDQLSARCRVLLNEAQREIDRLRRSMATPVAPQTPSVMDKCPCESPASPPTQRKSYAVDPIGNAPPPRDDAPPRVVGEKVIMRPHVTNVGSLLDVLV